jgi:hypothetical protein
MVIRFDKYTKNFVIEGLCEFERNTEGLELFLRRLVPLLHLLSYHNHPTFGPLLSREPNSVHSAWE